MTTQPLLIELFTEELPPKALPKLMAAFADTLTSELVRLGLVETPVQMEPFATPRRLAVRVDNVRAVQPEQRSERKGPAVASGYKDGVPTPALLGFARSCGVAVEALEQVGEGKQAYFVFKSTQAGAPLSALLAEVVQLAVKKLPTPKMMRWGSADIQFVRPVHRLVMLHGADVIEGEVLGLKSDRLTQGHRFMGAGTLSLDQASHYANLLETEGKVIASFDARRTKIDTQLQAAAQAAGAQLGADYRTLLEEVTALVEWPTVYEGTFSEDFLKVPQECLILTMQQNQKYFPLFNEEGKLLSRFLVVSNLQPENPDSIIHGNERVLQARLSDARFFFEQDQKQRLDSRLPRLKEVVYHNKIGSQWERVERLVVLSSAIADHLGAEGALAERAAWLAKADLLSEMVGEFPELQGLMGMYYAWIDNEPPEVAVAIEGHYHPRFAGDTLPNGVIAQSVALADKLETVVGIYGIGLVPTGDKDPFALRRHALGVLRMLLGLPLSLRGLLMQVAATFPAGLLSPTVVDDVHGFMMDRLKHWLSTRFPAAEVDAVLALAPETLEGVEARLAAVGEFVKLPEAAALAAANKRIRNILKKAEGVQPVIDPALFEQDEERALAEALATLTPAVQAALEAGQLTEALKQLAGLKEPVDAFFEKVMVMADNPAVKANRLGLLAALAIQMNTVAELSLLAD